MGVRVKSSPVTSNMVPCTAGLGVGQFPLERAVSRAGTVTLISSPGSLETTDGNCLVNAMLELSRWSISYDEDEEELSLLRTWGNP